MLFKLAHLRIHEYSLKLFGEKSIKNWETNHISAYFQHKLTKLVPKESLDIALLFTSHICKSAHLHIHEFSLKLIFGEKPETFSKYIGVYISIAILGKSASHSLEMIMFIG